MRWGVKFKPSLVKAGCWCSEKGLGSSGRSGSCSHSIVVHQDPENVFIGKRNLIQELRTVQCYWYFVLLVQVCQVHLDQGLKSLVLARFWGTERGQRLPVHPAVHQEINLEVDGALGAVGKMKVQVAEDQVEALFPDHQLWALALDALTDPLLGQAQLGAVHCAGHCRESKGMLAPSSTELPSALGHLQQSFLLKGDTCPMVSCRKLQENP